MQFYNSTGLIYTHFQYYKTPRILALTTRPTTWRLPCDSQKSDNPNRKRNISTTFAILPLIAPSGQHWGTCAISRCLCLTTELTTHANFVTEGYDTTEKSPEILYVIWNLTWFLVDFWFQTWFLILKLILELVISRLQLGLTIGV